MARPFPPAWLAILERNVALYARLSAEDHEELKRHILVFLDEKRFEGCGGLEMTDEIRVTIAAQACMLLLRRETDFYGRVTSILVYPGAFVVPVEEYDDALIIAGEEARTGEAWIDGSVVLSWEDAQHGAGDIRDGTNLILHEFAHQLDMEDCDANGAPVLGRRTNYVAWARVLSREFESLRKDAARGMRTLLDTYGAEDPAEFFAVATECFFENARALRSLHPELYEQLKHYYHQDPAAWGDRRDK